VREKVIPEVVINNPSRNVDKVFHYFIPTDKAEQVKVGVRVLVPFGGSNKKVEAFVINITDYTEIPHLKPISDVIDGSPLFNEKMIQLAQWMKKQYLCTLYEALKVIMPPGIGLKMQEWVKMNEKADKEYINSNIKNSKLQKRIVNTLIENGGSIEYNELALIVQSNYLRKSINLLQSKGIVDIVQKSYSAVKEKTVRLAYLSVSEEEALYFIEDAGKRAPVQAKMVQILLENETVALSDLVLFSKGSYSAVNSLYKKGIINFRSHSVVRNPYDETRFKKTEAFVPTDEQKNVIKLLSEKIKASVVSTSLLRGVTGSGKTEVFLQVIEYAISIGKQAIVLVPEISLTPQMVERFISRFGSRVAVFHSGLSLGERYDQWRKAKNGEVDVVVGARSAIFAPLSNLGIIILDEEHENTYKSEVSPRYHAREVAEKRAQIENAVVLLASATPSVESYYKAKTGVYSLFEMTRRYNSAPLPTVDIVDMREELANGNKSIFSKKLKEAIKYNLKNKQQTILFLNRRGFSTFVSCRNCGNVLVCPHCSISLTYHIKNNRLVCHYCGYSIRNVSICPTCGSNYIRYFGIGTQRVEEEIKALFPEATVIRMDVDTTGSKYSHEKILNTFRDKKIDILIGTQMVSKGLDFPDVTLVGVLAADMSLNIDDYRSNERTFQLITQVCGRAGRGNIEGKAIIQTYQPDNYTIQLASRHDYISFYSKEIKMRRQLEYPPFSQIVCILVTGIDEKAVIEKLNKMISDFRGKLMEKGYNSLCHGIFGPVSCPISKIKNKYRWRALIKCKQSEEILKVLSDLLQEHYGIYNSSVKKAALNIVIDVNPINLY